MPTTPQHHITRAEALIKEANYWMDADIGWKDNLTADERIARRHADLSEAQVHALLADLKTRPLTPDVAASVKQLVDDWRREATLHTPDPADPANHRTAGDVYLACAGQLADVLAGIR